MGPIIGVLMALGGNAVAGVAGKITVETIKLAAIKALMLFLVFVAFPILLYNVLQDFLFDILNYGVAYITGQGYQPLTIELTGMAGWIGQQIGISNMLSMYLTAVSTRFVMSVLKIF